MQGDTHPLAVARIGIGLLLVNEAWDAARGLALGFFGDRFHLSSLPESLVASRSVYLALVVAQAVLAILVVVGWAARPALLASAALILYGLLSDRSSYHHYRYSLLLFAGLLAFSPCDRGLVVGRRPGESRGPLWAQRLMQLQVSLMYLASGGSKLVDGDWSSGRVVADGVARFGHHAMARGAPAWAIDALQSPGVAGGVAKLAIATELFLAIALQRPRWRTLALFVGVWFHLLIQVSTSVATFSWLMLILYALFARTDHRARSVTCAPTAARAIAALDWLHRFSVVPRSGARLSVTDRDGRVTVGGEAVALLFRCLPILFPLWLPVRIVILGFRPTKHIHSERSARRSTPG